MVILGLTYSISAKGDTVAVLPVLYELYRTQTPVMERAEKVTDAIVRAIEENGMHAITGVGVNNALQAVSSSDPHSCTYEACLSTVAAKIGADYAVAVSLVDKEGQFEISVNINGAAPFASNPYGTFNSMIHRISGVVGSTIRELREKKESETSVPNQASIVEQPVESAPPVVNIDAEAESPPVEESTMVKAPLQLSNSGNEDSRKRRLPRGVFYSSLGITLAIGAAYASVESIGYVKWRDEKQRSESTPENEEPIENLRLSSRVLAGSLCAGVVATTIFAFFTDFKGGEKGVAVVPAFTNDAGYMLIHGRF